MACSSRQERGRKEKSKKKDRKNGMHAGDTLELLL
jgi:hypothetical protein